MIDRCVSGDSARADERRERGEIDVAAGHDGDDFAGPGAAAERGGDRAAGGAFGDDVRALGRRASSRARPRRAGRRSSRSAPRAAATSSSSTDLPPAPSTNDACPVLEVHRPARPRATRQAAPRSPARPRRPACRASAPATAAAMPASSPPPPSGATIASTSGRSSRISSADRAVAGDEAIVVERMDEVAASCDRSRARFDRAPALVVGRADDRSRRAARWRGSSCPAPCPSPSPSSARRPCARRSATPCAALPALTVHTPSRKLARATAAGRRCRRRGS